MPLDIAEIRDLRSFTQDWANLVIPRDAPGSHNDMKSGFNLGVADGATNGGFEDGAGSIYDHIRDRVLFFYQDSKADVGPGFTVLIREGIHCRDALSLNTSIGWFADVLDDYGQDPKQLKAGQPNLSTGAQKFYTFASVPDHFEIDPINGSIAASNIWPTLAANDMTDGVIVFNTEGYYDVDISGKLHYGALIFEGMVTATGYSELTRGSSYPLGLALRRVSSYNLVTSSNITEGWVWIDLNTNEAVGALDIPTLVDSASVNPGAEPSIDGKSTRWSNIQFVPDEGTTFAQPKGELHVFTMEEGRLNTEFEILNQSIVAPEQTFTSTTLRNFVSVYDFNPYDSQLGTVRVHNRRIFLGIMDTPQEPIISGGHNMTGTSGSQTSRAVTMIYHPPSRTYLNIVGSPETPQASGIDSPAVGFSRIVRLRRSTVVDKLSQPTPDSAVTENRTVRYRVVVHTDVNERAVSAAVTFVLTRRSTRAETFDGATQTTTPYAVEAAEIDDDGTLDVRSGSDFDGGGTLLVEGVDYSVVHATGTLTPLPTNWPVDDVFVRYRHRQVKLTPGHGTLLTGVSTTDGEGQAFGLVEYGANVDAEIDNVEASIP